MKRITRRNAIGLLVGFGGAIATGTWKKASAGHNTILRIVEGQPIWLFVTGPFGKVPEFVQNVRTELAGQRTLNTFVDKEVLIQRLIDTPENFRKLGIYYCGFGFSHLKNIILLYETIPLQIQIIEDGYVVEAYRYDQGLGYLLPTRILLDSQGNFLEEGFEYTPGGLLRDEIQDLIGKAFQPGLTYNLYELQ